MNWRISSTHLRCFMALAEELHFRKAAERLGVAQPALSQMIRRLEQDVGASLFKRTTRNVELTPAGRGFHEHVKRGASEIERAVESAQLLAQGGSGLIRIGFIQPAMYGCLPAAVGALRATYPRLEIQLTHLSSSAQIAALREGKLDVGFIRPPINNHGLSVATIAREGFSVVMRSDHPMASAGRCRLGDLAQESFVYFRSSEGDSFPEQVATYCRLNGFDPNFVARTTSVAATLALVAAGFGVAILPQWTRHIASEGLIFRELTEVPPIVELSLTRIGRSNSPEMQAFLEIVQACSLSRELSYGTKDKETDIAARYGPPANLTDIL